MRSTFWLRWLKTSFKNRQPRRGKPDRRSKRVLLNLEALEERITLNATYNVTSTTDFAFTSVNNSNGAITASGDPTAIGQVTLRSAIQAANNTPSASGTPNTINLPDGTYDLTTGTAGTGGTAELEIGTTTNLDTVIVGTSEAGTIINQTVAGARIFDIDLPSNGGILSSYSNLTIENGSVTDGGGAVLFGGGTGDQATFTSVDFKGNSVTGTATNAPGGAINDAGGDLSIINSTFDSNTVGTVGTTNLGSGSGAIDLFPIIDSTLTITGTTFINNQAAASASNAGGGAIRAETNGNNVTVNISGSTFTDNQITSGDTSGGGAIFMPSGSLTLNDDNFSGNQITTSGAGEDAGGAVYFGGSSLTATFDRFVDNSTAKAGAGNEIDFNASNGGTANIEDDWWGSNSGPASGDNVQTNPAGALAPTHWLVLSNSANPTAINVGDTSTLTADFIHDNNGADVSAMDPATGHTFPAFIGLAVTYGAPVDGTLSNEQTTIQSGGTATATYTGTTSGNGSSSVTVDGVTVTADVSVNAPAPILTSISPTSATVGDPDTTITLTGSSFINGSTADFNGTPLSTSFVSATELMATIPAADLTTAGTDQITVVTAGPGGGTSGMQTFTVNNPAPILTSINPTSATAGDNDTTITLTGSSFVNGSTADFNSVALVTTFVNATELTAIIPGADLTAAGMDQITVVTAGPGGGTSGPQTFTVNPAPTLTSINPTSATAGDNDTTITLTGTNFVNGFTADFNGTALATTFVSATELTAVIPATDLTTAGAESITVVAPGGSTTAAQTFTVNPAPTLTSINPTSGTVGDNDTTITLTGTNFVNGFTADFNGTALATTFVSATELTAVIPAADLTTAGAESITVVAPGGSTTAAQTFTVNPAPTLTSINPTSATAGDNDTTITLTGTNFVNGFTADFNGTALATTFVSATDLTAVIPAADLTTAGAESITVAAPGGSTTAAQTFTVNPAPTLTSINPTSATAGDNDTTITLTGTNFVNGFTADFNGTALATTFVSATELTAVIPAADLTTAGMESITVVAPGGSTTAAQTFTVNPALTLTSISPTSGTAGDNDTAITLTGTNFVNGFTADFNGTALATTFVSATELTAVIPAADLTTAGAESITVVAPGGSTTAAQTFTVNPAPTLTSINPTSATAGDNDTTITLTGTNFVNGFSADFNGAALATTFVSATDLTAVIPAADLTTAGADDVTVAAPGGSTTAAQTFTVNPAPILTSISPTSATAGDAATTITLTGANFVNGFTADFNGGALSTMFVSATELTAVIPAADLNTAGMDSVTVVSPGGSTTAAQTFTVNPVPILTSISPTSATAGDSDTTITLTGANFVSGYTADFNSVALVTTFVNATELTAVIPASDLATAGMDTITVVAPGGGTSNSQTFTINPAPTLTSINPTSATTGDNDTTITLTGTNFANGFTADFNGTALATTFVSATELTAVIPTADLITPGTESITVVAPGGSTTTAQTFTVNPAPTLTSISPTSGTVGDNDTTITLTGTNFANGFTADFNGTALATTFVSATELRAVIPAADLTTAGLDSVTVVAPGGSTTVAQTFTVNNPAPTLTSINPTSVTADSPDTTITLNGTNFVNGSTADFNGVPLATTFISATQLTAVVPAADLAAAGSVMITVVNSGPGGGTSAAQTLTINPAQFSPPFISVAFGPNGEVAEVVNSAGVLTQYSAAGVQVLGGGVRFASIAFGPNGEVVEVVSSAGILTQIDASGAHQLGGAGVASASVAIGPGGEVLEVVLMDGSVTQFSAAGVQELGTSGVVSASVAFGPSGLVVEILSTSGVLTQFTPAGSQQLGGAGVQSTGVAFDANSLVLDIIFSDGSLDQFDAFGVHSLGIVS